MFVAVSSVKVLAKQVKTEKSHKMQDVGVYVFLFPKNTRKDDIKKSIEKQYSVKVDFVNTVILPRKVKSFRGVQGVVSGCKKAYVKLAHGMKIEFDSVDKDSKN